MSSEKLKYMFSISPIKNRFYDAATNQTTSGDFDQNKSLDLPNLNTYDFNGNLVKEADQTQINTYFLLRFDRINVLDAKAFLDYQFARTPDKESFLDYIEFGVYPDEIVKGGVKELMRAWIDQRRTDQKNSEQGQKKIGMNEFDEVIKKINWVLDVAPSSVIKWTPNTIKKVWEETSFLANGIMYSGHECWNQIKRAYSYELEIAKRNIRHIILVDRNREIIPVVNKDIKTIFSRVEEFGKKYNLLNANFVTKNLWFLDIYTSIKDLKQWFDDFTDIEDNQKTVPNSSSEAFWKFLEESGLIERWKEKGRIINPTHNFEKLKETRLEKFEQLKIDFIKEQNAMGKEIGEDELKSVYKMWANSEIAFFKKLIEEKYSEKVTGKSASIKTEIERYLGFLNGTNNNIESGSLVRNTTVPVSTKKGMDGPYRILTIDGKELKTCADLIGWAENEVKRLKQKKHTYNEIVFWEREYREFTDTVNNDKPSTLESELFIDECRDYLSFLTTKINTLKQNKDINSINSIIANSSNTKKKPGPGRPKTDYPSSIAALFEKNSHGSTTVLEEILSELKTTQIPGQIGCFVKEENNNLEWNRLPRRGFLDYLSSFMLVCIENGLIKEETTGPEFVSAINGTFKNLTSTNSDKFDNLTSTTRPADKKRIFERLKAVKKQT